jgi:BON domain
MDTQLGNPRCQFHDFPESRSAPKLFTTLSKFERKPGREHSAVETKDWLIEARAEARLRQSAYLGLHRVRCFFQRGMLTLAGPVSSYFLHQTAQELVRSVHGIELIDNQLVIVAGRSQPERATHSNGHALPQARPSKNGFHHHAGT